MAMLGGLMVGACSVVGVRSTEQPAYDVMATVNETVEIRRYANRVAAEAVVEADTAEAGRNQAFQILFDYISGANAGAREIEMTAPVETRSRTDGRGAKIEMTAPVETTPRGDGRHAMRFFLPATYTPETAPVPTDPRVAIVPVPETTLGVLQFTGFIGTESVAARKQELIRTLGATPYKPAGEPVALFYDPPWTLPFLRRNEVAVEVRRDT